MPKNAQTLSGFGSNYKTVLCRIYKCEEGDHNTLSRFRNKSRHDNRLNGELSIGEKVPLQKWNKKPIRLSVWFLMFENCFNYSF